MKRTLNFLKKHRIWAFIQMFLAALLRWMTLYFKDHPNIKFHYLIQRVAVFLEKANTLPVNKNCGITMV